jgi:PEP-CTERM motif-containing protein
MKSLARFVAILTLAWAGAANAGPISWFNLEWEEDNGDGTASGMLAIDESKLSNPGSRSDNIDESVIDIFPDFMLTIGGGSAYSGVSFERPEFGQVFLEIFTPGVDLTQELFGQGVVFDFNFFNALDATTGASANGANLNRFDLRAFQGSVETYQLVSFAPKAVPLPSTLALFTLGLLAMRRRITA